MPRYPFPIRVWHPDPQEYAIAIAQANHNQALANLGEYTIFVLMWRAEDHESGLVERCSECYQGSAIADAYGQADREKCPTCFGTTFEGGYKARIVRLSLWGDGESTHSDNRRGEIRQRTASVQTSPDFKMRTGDYAIRGDGTRWRVQSIQADHLRTGFMMPSSQRTPVGYNYGQAILEDPASVAYIIPPLPGDLEIPQEVMDL